MDEYEWTSVHNDLRKVLSELYPDRDQAKRIASESRVNTTTIGLGDTPADNWHNIIKKAEEQRVLVKLVEIAIDENKAKLNKTIPEEQGLDQRDVASVLSELLEALKKQAKKTDRIDISAIEGKTKKIENQINFKEWTRQFIGENEFDKLDEMKEYLRGVMGKPKRIESGYLYWGLTPTQYWLDLCREERKISAITDFPRCWEDIKSTINDFPELHGYVSLGVGDGRKDLLVLSTLADKSSNLIYFPVDMSPEMLYFGSKYISNNINKPSIQIYPLQLDFSKPENLKKLRSMLDAFCENEPILFGLLGNTLSNFNNDQQILYNLSSILNSEDLLLLELAKIKDINENSVPMACSEYNQPKFKKFASCSLLQIVSIDYHPDWFNIIPEEEPIPNTSTIKALKIIGNYENEGKEEMLLHFIDDDSSFSFSPGDIIRLSMSRKYTDEGIDYLINNSNLKSKRRCFGQNKLYTHFGIELLLLEIKHK
jgi:hypothetical protein